MDIPVLDLVCMILTGLSSCLSIAGALLIFLTYNYIGRIRNFTRKLLLYLTIADFLTALGYLVATVRYAVNINNDDDASNRLNMNCSEVDSTDSLCIAQSFVTTYSNLASFIWTLIMAIHIWVSVVIRQNKTEVFTLHALYHVISWIVPFIIVLVALHRDVLGEDYCFGTGIWCGIKSNLTKQTIITWMFVADIAWQLTSYLLSAFFYVFTAFHLWTRYPSRPLSSIAANLRDEDRNAMYALLCIYSLKLWGIIRFFITTFSSPSTLVHVQPLLDGLLVLQSYGASGQAFWNCFLFCFLDSTVKEMITGYLRGNAEERRALLSDSLRLSVNVVH